MNFLRIEAGALKIFLLSISLLILPCCVSSEIFGKPSPPVSVRLSVSGEAVPNHEFILAVNISPVVNFKNCTLGINIPEGFELTDGNASWNLDLEQGIPVVIPLLIKPTREGTFSITALLTDTNEPHWLWESRALYFNISPERGVVSKYQNFKEPVYEEPKPGQVGLKISDLETEKIKKPVTTKSIGEISVSGRFVFYNNRTEQLEPLKYAVVKLMDDDTWTGDDELASGITDGNGYYEFTNVSNSDEGVEGQDVYVECFAENVGGYVRDSTGTTYSFTTATENNVPDGTNVDFHTYQPASSNHGAYAIANALVDGWLYVVDYLDTKPSQVEVMWYPGNTVGTWYVPGSKIDIRGDHSEDDATPDEWDKDIVLHEYGHFIMYSYAPCTNCGGTHSWWGTYTEKLAWSEAWAHFVSTSVRSNETEIDTWDTGYFVMNLETGTFEKYNNSVRISGPIDATGNGATCEASVSGILWDIHDSSNDGRDKLSNKTAYIWDVFDKYTSGGSSPQSINDFWTGWFACSTCNVTNHGYTSELNGIFYEHGVNKNTAPSIPKPYSPPNNSVTNSSSVFFLWNGSTDNENDTILYTLQVSNNSNFTALEVSVSNITDTSYNLTLIDGTHYWRVVAFDGINYSLYSIQFTILIDATPPVINLIQPSNYSLQNESTVTFIYNVSDQNNISKCYLIVNDSIVATAISPPREAAQNFTFFMEDGMYNFSIQCSDILNNTAQTSTPAFLLDTTPPGIITPRATPPSATPNSSVLLTANITDNNALSSVMLEVITPLSSQIQEVLTSNNSIYTFNFTNTSDSGIYRITFFANDTLGWSNSVEIPFVILGAGDNPPVIDEVGVSQNLIFSGSSVNFTLKATDAEGISSVRANVTLPNNGARFVEMNDTDNDSVYAAIFTDTELDGLYTVTFLVNDSIGQSNSARMGFLVKPLRAETRNLTICNGWNLISLPLNS